LQGSFKAHDCAAVHRLFSDSCVSFSKNQKIAKKKEEGTTRECDSASPHSVTVNEKILRFDTRNSIRSAAQLMSELTRHKVHADRPVIRYFGVIFNFSSAQAHFSSNKRKRAGIASQA